MPQKLPELKDNLKPQLPTSQQLQQINTNMLQQFKGDQGLYQIKPLKLQPNPYQ